MNSNSIEVDQHFCPLAKSPRRTPHYVSTLLLCWITLLSGTSLIGAPKTDPNLQSQLSAFIENRAKLADTLADKEKREVPKAARDYFTTARQGNFNAASNLYEKFQALSTGEATKDSLRADLYCVRQPVLETFGVWEIYQDWHPKFLKLYGEKVIESIPENSIYFGGTDPGRFIITIMGQAAKRKNPFIIITQNQLADGTYLNYLTKTLADQITVPTHDDLQRCFQEYLADVQKRMDQDRKFPNETLQIKPGENVKIVDNRVQVSGQTAVMNINALLVKIIFDKNLEREFYIEESFPLAWTNPYLTPHGFIFKLNRKALADLPPDIIQADNAFWNPYVKEWLGPWLTSETSVRDLADFVITVYRQENFKGFKGDPRLLKDVNARKAFSKMRSAQAGLYAWRAETAQGQETKREMTREAEMAFKQAFAMCPISSEALSRYVSLLASLGRFGDATLLAETILKLDPDDQDASNLLKDLKKQEKAPAKKLDPASGLKL
ncbi:MAG: hypothetical protein JWM16_3218 [Verrucomicrobiales bacterium]|nr:hypothetical protein [Verrucomicrobiales bacterium]